MFCMIDDWMMDDLYPGYISCYLFYLPTYSYLPTYLHLSTCLSLSMSLLVFHCILLFEIHRRRYRRLFFSSNPPSKL